MFGFSKAPDPKLVAGANQLAAEAVHAIAGSLKDGRLDYKDFAIRLDAPGAREGLKEAFLRKRARLSLNEQNWIENLKTLNEEQRDLPAAGNEFDIAAFLILGGLLKMNSVCKIALGFPKHQELRRTALAMLGTNGTALDHIFDADFASRHALDAGPSVELYNDFPSISAFFNKVLGD
ncbi:MAG: hypothetical protein K2Z80_22455 [Xanthobacteraceae bacterium]|jgi:hypothetical protein|nr:hypothetical protein [Xanthobacteraceae bacterium]